MFYEKKDGNDRKSAIRRRRDLIMREEDEIASKKKAIQTKLEISQPGDVQEKEADEVASKVVNGGDAKSSSITSASSTVSSKSEGDSTLYADDKLQRQLDSSKGSGQTMDDATKSEMETKMGADFSGVKIHTGSAAHTMSEDINAKAFTHGQDVYFKNGNYDPKSNSGKELLAHELHHTRQNGDGVNRKVWRQEDKDKGKTDEKSLTKTNLEKNQENTKADVEKGKGNTEKKKKENEANEKNTENKGKELKKEKKKKEKKKDKKQEKKDKKSIKDKVRSNKGSATKRVPDLSDLLFISEDNTPNLSWIKTSTDLKAFASSEKLLIENHITNELLKLNTRVGKNQKIVDDEYKIQTKQVDLAFETAIGRIANALTGAKKQAELVKKQKLDLFRKNSTDKEKSVNTVTEQKQQEVTELGESYAGMAVQHGEDIKLDAELRQVNQVSTIQKNAEDAVTPYAKHAKREHIVEEVVNLAQEMIDQIIETTDSLKEGITTDSSDLAQKFRDEAKTTAEGLPAGKEEVAKQIKAIYNEGVLQFEGVSELPLAELEKTLTKMSQTLLEAHKAALGSLAEIKKQADDQIKSNFNESNSTLQLTKEKATTSIDQQVSETEQKIAEPKSNEQQLVLAAADRIASSVFPLKKGVNDFLLGKSEAIQKQVIEAEKKITESGTASVKSANEGALKAETTAADTVKRISETYDSIIKKMTESMQEMVKKFSDGMDKTIKDQKTKWNDDLTAGKEGMDKKQTEAYEKNDEVVVGSKAQLEEKALDASEFTWGDFWMGVLGVIVGIIAAIAILLLLALIIMSILPFLTSLLMSAITFFCGEAFALLVSYLAAVLGPILMPYIMGALTGLAVYFIGKHVVETYNDPSKSAFDKGFSYGMDAVNLIASFLPFTKFKLPAKYEKVGALLGMGEAEAPTIQGLFNRYWTRRSSVMQKALTEIEQKLLGLNGDIDPVKLQTVIAELKSNGVSVMTGEEASVLLTRYKANALYVPGEAGKPGMLVFSETAPKNQIIEELMHLKQHQLTGFKKLSPQEIIEMEIDAHNQMINYAKKNNWEQQYIDDLERNKATWEGDQVKYRTDEKFKEEFDEKQGVFKNKGDAQSKINSLNDDLPSFCEIKGEGNSFSFYDNDIGELIAMTDIDSDGYITFAIYRKSYPTKASGQDIFKSFMKNFDLHGIEYNGINGVWGVSDNTTELNRLLLSNNSMSIEDAAKLTWTGTQAQKYGFNNVKLISKVPDTPPFTSVKVRFY